VESFFNMKNLAIVFVASSVLATVIACGSSSGGSGSTGASSGKAGDAAAADVEATDARPADGAASGGGSGDHSAIDARTGEAEAEAEADENGSESSDGSIVVGGVCKSAADCVDSGARAICCLGSSFEAVCALGGCALTSFGSYQLCASAAECIYPGQTYCGPFMGAVPGLVVCSVPPPDAGSVEDGG
jgi:hypothetical protein